MLQTGSCVPGWRSIYYYYYYNYYYYYYYYYYYHQRVNTFGLKWGASDEASTSWCLSIPSTPFLSLLVGVCFRSFSCWNLRLSGVHFRWSGRENFFDITFCLHFPNALNMNLIWRDFWSDPSVLPASLYVQYWFCPF